MLIAVLIIGKTIDDRDIVSVRSILVNVFVYSLMLVTVRQSEYTDFPHKSAVYESIYPLGDLTSYSLLSCVG